MHKILAVNADAVALYLNTQIEAGAQAGWCFDSWGGVLADGAFQEFSLAYTRRVLAQLKREHEGYRIPHIVFTKGGLWLDQIADTGCDVVGLDWTMNLGQARAMVGDRVALQATWTPTCCSLNPNRLPNRSFAHWTALAPHAMPTARMPDMCSTWATAFQFTPPEHVTALVDTVHSHSRKLRA